MSKTTNRTAPVAQIAQIRLLQIQPTVIGAGGGGGRPTFDGNPEHVPDMTFIVQRRTPTDDFINGANAYHTNCGLQPQEIRSLEHLVTLLSSGSGPLKRVRIVTHAVPTNMAVAMFEGSTYFHAEETFLRGFGESDIAGIYAVLGRPTGQHFINWNIGTITNHIRATNAGLLTPFGFNQSGTPTGDLAEFIAFCSDRFFINADHGRVNGQPMTTAERNILLSALAIVIAQTGSAIEGTTFGTHTVVAADLRLLRDFIFGMTLANFGFLSVTPFNFTVPPGAQTFPVLERAVAAIGNNFRTKLNSVKARFTEASFIDIRGCRAGERAEYLEAVQLFFGRVNHFPKVSAPRWFQFFGEGRFSSVQNNAEIRALLQTGTNAAVNRAGFEDWAERSRVNSLHKSFWLDLLADTPAGIVVRFCLMTWRNNFPQLPLQTPGLTAFAALNFKNAIAKVAEFFNLPSGSIPSGTALTNLDTFVTGQLTQWGPNLTAVVNNSTSLPTLYQALQDINNALSQTLVPPPPNPLLQNHVTDAQTALIEFIEQNRLAAARSFMTAVRQRIQDINDPGFSYYMLHAGMPVFVFANIEQVNNHAVSVTRNRLVVHRDFANSAYRQWPPLLWAEALPAANRFGTLTPASTGALRFAMMVELATGGNTPVATCPHPDYMDKMRFTP